MKQFDNRELHTIKMALVQRVYYLDDLILQSKDEVADFLHKERKDCLGIIKKIES